MTAGKWQQTATPFGIRAVGKGFALTIRQMIDAHTAHPLRKRAEYELNNLPPELQRDVGWFGRYSHDKN